MRNPGAEHADTYTVDDLPTQCGESKGETMSNLPPPPGRKDFPIDDACEEALGFWQCRVGGIQGLVRHARLNVAPVAAPAPNGLDEQMATHVDAALSTLLAALSESSSGTPGPTTNAAVLSLQKIVAAGGQTSTELRDKQRRLLEMLKGARRPDDGAA